mmetsp:Transcript_38006/g.38687  ORF Transcript_38006/g.38687 Transcript_38006/m.38687 type:complete len:547 (+) Transcript_38006:229-1869(+)
MNCAFFFIFVALISAEHASGFWEDVKKGSIQYAKANEKDPNDYGVDVSTSIHHEVDPNSHMGKRYYKSMEGCYKKYDRFSCDSTERARINMNLDQPRNQHNYTEIGFKKWTVPAGAWELLKSFWETNKNNAKNENWPRGNTYVNHWDSPSEMVSLEDGALRGAGTRLKQKIWDAVKPLLEEWTGKKLKETSMYGIRVYHRDAMLATHVDRLPLVTSCIIQVDQEVEEPWPVEVYDHHGKAHNVTMKPGEMVFYESHTVLHGRPFPLNGSFYANLFVHYIPIDHKEMNAEDISHPMKTATKTMKIGGHEQSNHGEEELANHKQILRKEYHERLRNDTKHELSKEEIEKQKQEEEDLKLLLQDLPEEEQQQVLEEIRKENKERRIERHHKKELIKERHEKRERERDNEQEEEDDELELDIDDYEESYEDLEALEAELELDTAISSSGTSLHHAAARGNLQRVKQIVTDMTDKTMINSKDHNLWQPIHEAVRTGNIEMVKYLIENGAELHHKTKGGGTPLWWARRELGNEHSMISFLESLGAPDEGEDL